MTLKSQDYLLGRTRLTAGSLPIGGLAIVLLLLAIPSQFPYHARSNRAIGNVFSPSNLKRLDFLGAALLLCGSFSLVAALLEASIRYSWSSGITIALLVFSALCWIGFFACEWFFTNEKRKAEPIFPWRFLYHRPWMGMLMYVSQSYPLSRHTNTSIDTSNFTHRTTFLVGVPFNVVVVTLPQRFQAVSGTTALGAGIRLLPYSFSASFGALTANIAGAKGKIAPMYLLFVGALCQVLGLSLLSTLSTSAAFPAAGYGYEVLAGVGVGVTFGILVLATPFVAEPRDLGMS